MELAALPRHFLLAAGDEVVRLRVERLVKLVPKCRHLALPQLELLELDQHALEVEEGLGRHPDRIDRSPQTFRGSTSFEERIEKGG